MEHREYGYVRVSTKEQDESRQVLAMTEAGIDERNIIVDKQSGKDFNRKGYNSLVGTPETAAMLREGDLLVIMSIDRLGRNYTEIMKQWQYITRELKADIRVLDMPLLDTRQGSGSLDNRFVADLVLQILSYVAQKERENIKHRQAEGIKAMKATCDAVPCVTSDKKKFVSRKTGRATGRPEAEYPADWERVYTAWRAGNIKAVEAMKELSLTKNTFYNLVKRYETR